MSKGYEDYIRSFSSLSVVNTFYKVSTLSLAIVCIGLIILVFTLLGQVKQVMPLPIYIDKSSGSAKPVEYSTIDASGETRIPVEIMDFCSNYVTNLYTFNRYTIKSNLDIAFGQSLPEVTEKLKYYLNESLRAKYLNSSSQGICEVVYSDIISAQPELKVQVAFKRKVLNERGEFEVNEKLVAIMKIKSVVRSMKNAHGLLVIDYRESQIPEVENE